MQETTGRLIGYAVSFFLITKDNALYVRQLHTFLKKYRRSFRCKTYMYILICTLMYTVIYLSNSLLNIMLCAI